MPPGSNESHSYVSRRSLLRWGAGGTAGALAVSRLQLPSLVVARLDATPALVSQPGWPIPSFVTRAQWGADESIREPGQEYSDKVEKIIVHHTVTPNNPPDPKATMRGIYEYHVSREYIDIAYNWAIDHRGRIYQGRWAAADSRHVGEAFGVSQVNGGHTEGFNRRSIGIAMLGTFTNVMPSEAAIDALVTLLTWKCARWGIHPTGRTSYRKSNGTRVTVPNIMVHRDAKPTTCPGDPLIGAMPLVRGSVSQRLGLGAGGVRPSKYWILGVDGTILPFGGVSNLGSPKTDGVVGVFSAIAGRPSLDGYWVLGSKGGVFVYGSAVWMGSATGFVAPGDAVDIAATRTGNGYWILSRDGTVFPFGDARDHGSTKALRLNAPVRRLVPTPEGGGYWVVAEDGGVFSFGTARFFGSTGNIRLNKPIVSMAPTPTGDGYWLVATDGGVFSFGDARFYGSTGSLRLVAPVIDVAATQRGLGYGLLAADGGIFAFGDAGFSGSAAGKIGQAVGFAGKFGI